MNAEPRVAPPTRGRPSKRVHPFPIDASEFKRQMLEEDCVALRSDGMLSTADCLAEFAVEAALDVSTLSMLQVLSEGLKADIEFLRTQLEAQRQRTRQLEDHITMLADTNKTLQLQLRLVAKIVRKTIREYFTDDFRWRLLQQPIRDDRCKATQHPVETPPCRACVSYGSPGGSRLVVTHGGGLFVILWCSKDNHYSQPKLTYDMQYGRLGKYSTDRHWEINGFSS